MVEISAQLVQGPVFLSGETIECAVTFVNTKTGNASDRSEYESLAWASAQILCQCSVNESRVKLYQQSSPSRQSSKETTSVNRQTSFVPSTGERGMTVLSSKPTILFCDLNLNPGETKTYIYREEIPKNCVPSFKGQNVKYSYKVTIGAQKVDQPTRLLKIPFRVLSMQGLAEYSVYQEMSQVKPSNPFVQTSQKQPTVLDVALEILQTVTSKKAPHFFNITNTRGKVTRFCLFKEAYKLGDDVIGSFDFSSAEVPCVQFTASLQSIESIKDSCKAAPDQQTTVFTHGKKHEFSLHMDKTHISLQIPDVVTPSFDTDIVSLKWRLHFEFVISVHDIPGHPAPKSPTESSTWRGPANLEVENMEWDLPIKVFPTNPLHLSDNQSKAVTKVIVD